MFSAKQTYQASVNLIYFLNHIFTLEFILVGAIHTTCLCVVGRYLWVCMQSINLRKLIFKGLDTYCVLFLLGHQISVLRSDVLPLKRVAGRPRQLDSR